MGQTLEPLPRSDGDGSTKSSAAEHGSGRAGPQLLAHENQPTRFEDMERVIWQVDPEKRIATWGKAYPIAAEKFRVMRHRLQQLRQSRPLSRVLVTSAIPREGKTVVATNLAFALVRTSPHVLLVDADLRLPAVNKLLGLEQPMAGLAEVVEGRLEARAAIRRLDPSGLCLLPAGRAMANPLELLQSSRTQEVLTEISSAFEWIVVDAPPVNLFADSRHLAHLMDAVVLVARVGVTPRESLKQVSAALEGAFIAGVVVNSDVDFAQDRYYYSYYPGGADREFD